jgi:sugar lactone lactonase YvrE
LVTLAVLIGALLLVASAQAAPSYVSSGEFGYESFNGPTRVAVEDTSGNVLVVESGADRVRVFAGGTAGTELTSFGAGELSSPYGIAIDQQSGDVYVSDAGNSRVARYTTNGAATPTYTLDATYEGPEAADVGSFASPIAIDPSDGDLLIADTGKLRVSRFDSSGAFVSAFDGSGLTAGAFSSLSDLALDSAGHVYVVGDGTTDPSLGGASGRRAERFAADGTAEGPVGPGLDAAESIAVDPDSGDVLVATRGSVKALGGADLATLHVFHEGQPLASVQYRNSDSNPTGEVRAIGLAVDGGSGRVYGLAAPLPETFIGPWGSSSVQVMQRIFIPELTIDPASAVAGNSAHLSGTVNPGGEADVEYRFEYSADGGTTWSSTPEAAAGTGTAPEAVAADIDGLAAASEYRFRLAASSAYAQAASGELTFQTSATAPLARTNVATDRTTTSALLRGTVNPSGLQTTYFFEYGTTAAYGQRVPLEQAVPIGAGAKDRPVAELVTGLSAGTTYHYRVVAQNSLGTTFGLDRSFTSAAAAAARAYEMVSPLDKGGAGVSLFGIQASVEQGAISFGTLTPLPGAPAAPLRNHNLAVRTPGGWATTSLDLPQAEQRAGLWYTMLALSSDLGEEVAVSTKALAPGAVEGDSNVYLRDTATGALTTLASSPGTTAYDVDSGISSGKSVAATTPDFSHIILRPSSSSYAAGDPFSSLYEWSDGDLSLISRGADGTPLPNGSLQAAISADGSTVAYVASGGGEGLYVRDGAGDIVQLSSTQSEVSRFSNDGNVLFLLGTALTPDAPTNRLSLFRYVVSTHQLTFLSAVDQQGVKAVTGDGSYVFFANSAEPGHLLFWHDGDLGQLPPGTFVGVSPSGRYALIRSEAKLTDYDPHSTAPGCPSGACRQLYRFDTVSEETICVSCRPDDGEPTGPADAVDPSVTNGARIIEDGRVFFTTSDPLAVADTNEKLDAYEFDGAQARLISAGDGPGDSYFQGVSDDGVDVYFTTNDRLVGIDTDGQTDLYDARVGGGIAAQNPPDVPTGSDCEGERCLGAPSAPAPLPSAGSGNFAGPGSPSQRKHKKKHHKKHKKHHHKRRAAGNGQGGGK